MRGLRRYGARWIFGAALFVSLSSGGWAQKVTFDVYPPESSVYRTGGTANGLVLLSNLESSNQVDLTAAYDDLNLIEIVVSVDVDLDLEAPGRYPKRQEWRRGFARGNLQDGQVLSIYLHPVNKLQYLADFPRYMPKTFAATLLCGFFGLTLAGIRANKRWKRKAAERHLQNRRDVISDVGGEYERIFGKWLIVGKIGSGGMGEVLRAFPQDDVRHETMVAIKMRTGIDTERATKELTERDTDDRKRFQIETKVLCGLNHPGIVKIHDWGELDGKDYYVMDLVKGESLQSYLDRCPMPSYGEVRSLFLQMIEVVDFAHEKRVLHRDLKPLNILRSPEGKLTIIDFGLARDQSQTVAYTQVGMPFAGSLEYMDPRVSLQMFGKIQATPSDAATDQFALGAILFLMLTGRSSIDLPEDVDGGGLIAVLTKISEPRPSPLLYRPDLPPALADVVSRMLAVDAADRFSSLDEARKAFTVAMRPLV